MANLTLTSISLNNALYIASALVLTVYLGLVFRSYWRLRHFPGPFLARFTGLWYTRLVLSGSLGTSTTDLIRKYGPIVVVGPDTLVTMDMDLIRKMNATRSPYIRAESYKLFRFKSSVDNVVSTLDDERHTYLKNKMLPGYTGKGNPNLEQQINNRIHDMTDLIDRKYTSTGSDLHPLDFAPMSSYFTLDTLTDIVLNRPLGYLINDSDYYDYLPAVKQTSIFTVLVGTYPQLIKFFELEPVRKLFAPTPNDAMGFGKVMGIFREVTAERFAPGAKAKQDTLQSFIHHGLTQEECESETLLQMIAGSDTTATALRTTMFHLISQPQVYNTLRAEIDAASEKNLLTSPIASDLEAKELPYLQACIREGLRICPPANTLFDRVTPPEGDNIHGRFIPGNTKIGHSFWAVTHSKEIFGADADLFRPDRWFEAEGEQKYQMEKAQEMVFNIGRYMCMGKTIAFMELNKSILELIRRYDWARIDPNKPFVNENYGLVFQSQMWYRVSKRAPQNSS